MNMLILTLAVLTAGPNLPPSLDLGGSGAPPPYGISDFTSHGRGLPAWAPAPTVALDGAAYKPGDATWVGQGVTMTKVGAPLAWYGSPFYPDGFEEAQRYAAGGLSDSVYYQLGTGPDVLDFTGDFWGCITFVPTSYATSPVIFSNGGSGGPGYYVQIASSGAAKFVDYSSSAIVANTVVLGVENVFCFGREGIYTRAVLNNGEVVAAGATAQAGTDRPAYIGKFWSDGFSYGGRVSEISFTGSVSATAARIREAANSIMRCNSPGHCHPEGATTHVTFDASGNATDSKGLAWAKQGTPTALAAPYVWPGNRTPLAHPSVKFDGSSAYFNGGDIADPDGSFTLCVEFVAGPALGALVSKDSGGARGWGFTQDGTSITLAVFKDNSTYTLKSMGTPENGAQYLTCTSYEWIANGTSIIRGATNGVAVAPTTNAVGPVQNVAAPFLVGYDFAARYFAGKIGQVWYWNGWAASDSEMDGIYRHYVGLTTEKPANVAIPFTRNDSHSACCATTEASCHKLGANMPCITRRGIERVGPTSNLLATSIDIGSWVTWSPGHVAPVRTSNTTETTDPLGGNTAAKVVFPAVGAGQISLLVSPQFAQTATPYAFGLWAKVPSGTWRTYLSCYSTGYYAVKEITITSNWQRLSTTGTSPGSATQSCSIGTDLNAPAPGETATDAGTVYLWAGQAHAGGLLLPYRASTGTPYSGPETVISVPDARKDYGRFAVSWTGTLDAWDLAREYRVLWSYGSVDTMDSATFYLRMNSDLNLFAYDSGGLTRVWSGSPGVLAPGEHSILLKYSAPLITSKIDSAPLPGLITTTARTGVPTATQPLNLMRAGTDTYSATGWVKRIVQCPSERNCK